MDIPLFPNILNYGLNSFEHVSARIDSIPSRDREWEKVPVLVNDVNYIQFLMNICKISSIEVILYLNDYYLDNEFKNQFYDNLVRLEEEYVGVAGDVRFNSLTLYVCCRAFKPDIVVETGVAAGKSSAIILLALHHNKKGKLYSIDKPNFKGELIEDNAHTTTRNLDVGWVVPNYLRSKWTLELGDSLQLLPIIIDRAEGLIDIFFHDSLHTKDHVCGELEIIDKSLTPNSLILVDDIDTGAGVAFSEYLAKKKNAGFAYREMAGARFC